MDIEQKAKAYDEALNIAKETYETQPMYRAWLEKMFPELRESEDERMIRVIGLALTDVPEERFTSLGTTLKDCLAYLEKQKDAFENGRQLGIMQEQARKELGWPDEKQKEQKHAHTAKEMWEEMRLEVYAQASGNRHEPNYSDDSTKMFSLCDIDEIFEKIGNSTVGSQPAEWSEEDEEKLKAIRTYLRDYRRLAKIGDVQRFDGYCNWLNDRLKSLRPQSHWKPSEYTLSLVKKVASGEMLTHMEQMAMETLYDDLQKL